MKKIILIILIAIFISVEGCSYNNGSPVSVRISSNPSGAQLYLDKEFKGYTPLDIDITKTKHRIVISKTGYSALKADIYVYNKHSFTFALKSIPIEKSIECGRIELFPGHQPMFKDNKFIFVDHYYKPERLYIHCIDLDSYNELWRFEIKAESNFDLNETRVYLIDNLLYAYTYRYSGKDYLPYLYIIDMDGKLVLKEKLPFLTHMPDKDVVILVDQNIVTNPNPTKASLRCYSLRKHKIVWEEDIKVGVAVSRIFGNTLYIFSINENSLRIHKINKFTGEILLVKDFPEIRNFPVGEDGLPIAAPLTIVNGKAFFSSDGKDIYCIDLENMKILYRCDTGIYFHSVEAKDNLLFVTGSGKTVAIDINDGKVRGTYKAEFRYSSVAAVDGKVFIGVAGDRIHCFNTNGKEIEFPYSPNMFGGSFMALEIASNTLTARTVSSSAGNHLYVFNLKTNEPLFSLEDVGGFYIVKSLLIVIPLTEPGEKKKIIFIDLGKFSKYP